MDTSAADVARLARVFAGRAVVLALLAGLAGHALIATVVLLAGAGLVVVAAGESAAR